MLADPRSVPLAVRSSRDTVATTRSCSTVVRDVKKLAFLLCALLFLGVPLALAAAFYLCFQDEPLLRRTAEFTPDDVERAVRIFERHDPRRIKSGALRTMTLRGDELDLAVNYLANRFGKGSSRLALRPGVLSLTASVEVPASPFGRYVNVQAVLRETAGLPAVEELRIGRLPVPNVLADWALARAMRTLDRTEQYQLAADTIRSVSIADGSVRIVYEWRDDLPDRVGKVLVSPADTARLKVYQERLVQLTRDAALPRSVSVSDLLSPLMRLAAERGTDPQAESRAAIVVVAFYTDGDAQRPDRFPAALHHFGGARGPRRRTAVRRDRSLQGSGRFATRQRLQLQRHRGGSRRHEVRRVRDPVAGERAGFAATRRRRGERIRRHAECGRPAGIHARSRVQAPFRGHRSAGVPTHDAGHRTPRRRVPALSLKRPSGT